MSVCLGVCVQNLKNQDLGRMADALRNHSVELKEEVEKLNDELNDGKHINTHAPEHQYMTLYLRFVSRDVVSNFSLGVLVVERFSFPAAQS